MSNHEPNSRLEKDNTELRRKFLKGAALGAPIISSIASKPVWGAGICALSGSLSGNMSNHGTQYSCDGPTGRSPGFWSKWWKVTSSNSAHHQLGLKVLYNWREAGAWPSYSFSNIFGATPGAGVNDSLGHVMELGGASNSFDRHVVAAYLSARHPMMSADVPYTAQQVIDAFQIVARQPGSTRANDIIEIFDSIFTSHTNGQIYKNLPPSFTVDSDEVKAQIEFFS
ncbi:hypothetical protein ACFSJY_04765 [Thalassotalea euphylliae]|uniref:hypothetical protein n=1 Tax=Thalassotalea euphylliae TaxID=1655234 RepID=UPI00363FBD5F